jgi:predicted nuclease with TOPRIM domain
MTDFLNKDFLADWEIRQLMQTREGRFALIAYTMKENLEMSLAEMFIMLDMTPPSKEVQNKIIDMFIKNVFAVPFGLMFDKMNEKKSKIEEINDKLKEAKLKPTTMEEMHKKMN